MKILKRILFFISFFIIYIIIKEFLQLYTSLKIVHPYAGYAFLIILSGFMIWFIGLPIARIMLLRQHFRPTRNPDEIPKMIQERIRRFQKNPCLKQSNINWNALPEGREGYDLILSKLAPEVQRIRRRYVTQVFYTTAIAQNGFLDAVLILSASVNLIKDLFYLHHGRVSNRDLWTIARMVYFSVAVGGSEGVEYVTEEIVGKLFGGGLKGVPFAAKVLGSIADGFVNAALLTRISLITENYCQMIFAESDRALYPSYRSVVSATKILTSDLIERIVNEIKALAKNKTGEVLLMAVNPAGTVISKVMNKYADESDKLTDEKREWIRDVSSIVNNPFAFAAGKVGRLFRKKPYEEELWYAEE